MAICDCSKNSDRIVNEFHQFQTNKKADSDLFQNKTSVKNWAAEKSLKVAWFVSNCFTANGRQDYANELAKHIEVDIFGRCGQQICKKGSPGCKAKLRKYKFYLAFENSNCVDYITEKFFAVALKLVRYNF